MHSSRFSLFVRPSLSRGGGRIWFVLRFGAMADRPCLLSAPSYPSAILRESSSANPASLGSTGGNHPYAPKHTPYCPIASWLTSTPSRLKAAACWPAALGPLGLMPPWALITRCQGTLSWWNRALLAADGRFLRQTPTCLEGGQAIRGCCSNRHGAVEGGCTWHTGASPPAGQCARSW